MFEDIKRKHDEEVLRHAPSINLDIVPIKITREQASKIELKDITVAKREVIVGTLGNGSFYVDIPHSVYSNGERVYGYSSIKINRKEWGLIINAYSHLELIQRALEIREHEKKDITSINLQYDDEAVTLRFKVLQTSEEMLLEFYDSIERILNWATDIGYNFQGQIFEAHLAQIKRFNKYNLLTLPDLLASVDKVHSSNEKGRVLEELIVKLFLEIDGFRIQARVKNSSEEIDVTIENRSTIKPWNEESVLILVECKNWSKKCRSKDLRDFIGKINNRRKRCRIGFFISWNGFTKGFKDELLRNSRTDILLVPVSGKMITKAIRNCKPAYYVDRWREKAIFDRS
ncbi:MAG: restriction endonuclease [Cyanobacteria bacterium J06649_11]